MNKINAVEVAKGTNKWERPFDIVVGK